MCEEKIWPHGEGLGVQSTPKMKNAVNIVAAVGLAFGAVFGLAGTMVTKPNLQATSWEIDGVGLVMAARLAEFEILQKGE